MAKLKFQVFAIVPALVFAEALSAGDDLPALVSEQIARLNDLSCDPWHGRGVAKTWGDPNPPPDVPAGAHAVVVLCEAHDTFRDSPVMGVARCHGQDLQWTCRANGLQLDYRFGGTTHQMQLVDTMPKTGAEIFEHLAQRSRKGNRWAKFAIEQFLAIAPFGEDGTFHVSYEWMDQDQHGWMTVIEVRRRCSSKSCRYESKYLTSYPTYK